MDELAAYRRKILVGYTVAGVAASLLSLAAVTTDMLQGIPLPEALGFLAVMIIPICAGSVIANDVASPDVSWSPFAHWPALKRGMPIVLGGIAIVIAIDVALYLSDLPHFLMALPPIIGGWLLNQWVQER